MALCTLAWLRSGESRHRRDADTPSQGLPEAPQHLGSLGCNGLGVGRDGGAVLRSERLLLDSIADGRVALAKHMPMNEERAGGGADARTVQPNRDHLAYHRMPRSRIAASAFRRMRRAAALASFEARNDALVVG